MAMTCLLGWASLGVAVINQPLRSPAMLLQPHRVLPRSPAARMGDVEPEGKERGLHEALMAQTDATLRDGIMAQRRAGKSDREIMQSELVQDLLRANGDLIDDDVTAAIALPRKGATPWGRWSQSSERMTLELFVDTSVRARDVRCEVGSSPRCAKRTAQHTPWQLPPCLHTLSPSTCPHPPRAPHCAVRCPSASSTFEWRMSPYSPAGSRSQCIQTSSGC